MRKTHTEHDKDTLCIDIIETPEEFLSDMLKIIEHGIHMIDIKGIGWFASTRRDYYKIISQVNFLTKRLLTQSKKDNEDKGKLLEEISAEAIPKILDQCF